MKKKEIHEKQPDPAPVAAPGKDYSLHLAVAVLIVVVLAVMIIRFKAAPVPLERDEGEYALMGQLILDGVAPYREAGSMKLPGIYYAYSAVLTVFGQTITGIHEGLMVVNLLSAGILFLIAMPLLGGVGAALATAAFSIMSVDLSVLGLFAHATHFVVLFALAGIWLLQESSKSKREITLLWSAGLCFGLSLLMKQSGAFFALFGFLWVLFDRPCPTSWKRSLLKAGTMAGGVVLPYAAILLLLAGQGVLGRFWFWTVDYARSYASLVDLKTGIELFQLGIGPIIRNNPVICALALAGMIGIWFTGASRRTGLFLISFFLFSFLAVCPGLYFRQHYFVQLLPAVALGAGAALRVLENVASKCTRHSKAVGFATFLAVAAFSLAGTFSIWRDLSTFTPEQFSRSVYGANPFPESVKVAEYISENTRPGDRIAVLGSEPQIYFYAHRRPASEHIYMYGLMEPQPFALSMQEDMIAQVEKSEPQFVVLVLVPTSWLQRRESETKVLNWLNGYLSNYYQPAMAAAIYSNGTEWLIGEDARSSPSRLRSSQLIVFKRKPPAE